MKTRLAFLGFRHGHVRDAWRRAMDRKDVEIVAASEEDAEVRAALGRDGIAVTHREHRAVLESVDCDGVVVGDVFGRRGAIVADALAAGRHVLSDKPACTSLVELDRIEELARSHRRSVGMMLELRDHGVFTGVRRLVREGAIGEVRAASFGGQHPLLLATRPSWYHEPGAHLGTINEIAIHGIDALPWMTGLAFSKVVAAREWQHGVPAGSRFRNAAQLMLAMENGCGVIADVSCVSPDSLGCGLPLSWRFTLWGSGGVLETALNAGAITLYKEGEPAGLTTAEVFAASRVALKAQQAADEGLHDVAL